ncbi:HNH endonuclease [uncultured Paenibacillus sp.]|uniref:HNH endonuclease n=1 Tax=uncultured Paenibacillus sp. TaxID=227322 RepID=UPI0037DD901F
MNDTMTIPIKICAYCGEPKPLSDFLRRTGRRSGTSSRRGACRECRKRRKAESLSAIEQDPIGSDNGCAYGIDAIPTAPDTDVPEPHRDPLPSWENEEEAPAPKRKRKRRRRRSRRKTTVDRETTTIPRTRTVRPMPEPPPRPEGPDASVLVPTRQGIIRMRGKTDKGRRWNQETDLETAVTLVNEHAAVVVNRHTIRRLYSNKAFRKYILTRDRYTCHFCGEYGDTIDHVLPRAKGGHTTPVNCVTACNLCNQSKADRDLDEFMSAED